MTAIIYKFPEREPVIEDDDEDQPFAQPVEKETSGFTWFILGGLLALFI